MEREKMDLQDHGDMGNYGCGHRIRNHADSVLHRSILAGCSRSWLLSRCHRLSDALVCVEGSSSRDLVFLDCVPHSDDHWTTHLGAFYRYRTNAPGGWG